MTATEIAKTILYSPVTNNQHTASIEKGEKIIEEYAKQQSIEFAEWITNNGYIRNLDDTNDRWMIWKQHSYKPQDGEWIAISTGQLYKLWMKEK